MLDASAITGTYLVGGVTNWDGRRPSPVSAYLPIRTVRGVLLAWARIERTSRWAAAIAYLHKTWHSRALTTVCVSASLAQPHAPAQQHGEYVMCHDRGDRARRFMAALPRCIPVRRPSGSLL